MRTRKGFHYDKKFLCQNEDFQHSLIRNFLRKVNIHKLNDKATHNVAIKVKGGETVLVKKAAANSVIIQNAYFTHDNKK